MTAKLGEQYLPAAPFIAWLADQEERLRAAPHITGGVQARQPVRQVLARRLGITDRTLRRFSDSRNGDGVPVTSYLQEAIEDMLWHAGVELWEVYPQPEVVVPADEWCDRCVEMVTPIWEKGALVCPWCTPPAVRTCDVPGCSTGHVADRLCARHLRMVRDGRRVDRWRPAMKERAA